MPDIASSIRNRYTTARAMEVVAAQIMGNLKEQVDIIQATLRKTANTASAATAVAGELREIAKDAEIDLSDETLGEALVQEIEVQIEKAQKDLGVRLERQRPVPKGVPERGRVVRPGTVASPAAAGVRPPEENGAATPPAPPSGPRLRPHAAGEPPPTPPTPPAAPAASAPPPAAPPGPPPPPGGAQVPPGGKIVRVSPRAAEALRRVKDGAKDGSGMTHRADAMVDPETGRAIPVDEQITVDDDAPTAEGAAREGDDKGHGTISVPDGE